MRVLLDACVLYPTVLREILIGTAAHGAFRPVWSARILEEWARATRKLGPEGEALARAEIAALSGDWPEAAVAPRAGDLGRLWLPDPDDVHVLAAAIAGHADTICTFNARDFPRATLAAEGLERHDPDQLLRALHERDPQPVEAAIADAHARAERISGEALSLRPFLKRARLPRLARRMA
ncbi:PIN domain-containing protein [Palleronia sediminis]|uniref:PIN domain-containing protein n=1 Tax=Palleronia sediminis TaxID=2547833 RepID=A0A4R6AIM1_9RHOB|nr:PIN domain-containing protein [Palleronia sediminis]TDL81223.1 PIN domain-containing protein [Palleronia sediminis]